MYPGPVCAVLSSGSLSYSEKAGNVSLGTRPNPDSALEGNCIYDSLVPGYEINTCILKPLNALNDFR